MTLSTLALNLAILQIVFHLKAPPSSLILVWRVAFPTPSDQSRVVLEHALGKQDATASDQPPEDVLYGAWWQHCAKSLGCHNGTVTNSSGRTPINRIHACVTVSPTTAYWSD
jgi:hypothetical protein